VIRKVRNLCEEIAGLVEQIRETLDADALGQELKK
jgi:hypothetical protein